MPRRKVVRVPAGRARTAPRPLLVLRRCRSPAPPPSNRWPPRLTTSSKNVPNRPDSRPGNPNTRSEETSSSHVAGASLGARPEDPDVDAPRHREEVTVEAAELDGGRSQRVGIDARAGVSHARWDGAYFEWVDSTSIRSPAASRSATCAVEGRVVGVDHDLDVAEQRVQVVVHRPADERDSEAVTHGRESVAATSCVRGLNLTRSGRAVAQEHDARAKGATSSRA